MRLHYASLPLEVQQGSSSTTNAFCVRRRVLGVFPTLCSGHCPPSDIARVGAAKTFGTSVYECEEANLTEIIKIT